MSLFSFTIVYGTPPQPQSGIASGGWGTGAWGTGVWGANQDPPPQINSVTPGVVNELGGDTVALIGNGFNRTAVVALLQNTQVVGQANIADLLYDLTPNKLYVGLPALETGFYDIRITTNGGTYTRTNAVEYRPFAYELKTEDVRRKWARAWNLGARQLGAGG